MYALVERGEDGNNMYAEMREDYNQVLSDEVTRERTHFPEENYWRPF